MMYGETLADRYERTMSRLEQMKRAGYQIRVQWECEFDDAFLVKEKPELRKQPTVEQSTLNTRDSLYGGRTEAMRLHYKVRDDEPIQPVDVMRLHPFI